MNKSCIIQTALALLGALPLFSSCQRCTSCGESIMTTGASLSGPDSIANLKPAILSVIPSGIVVKRNCDNSRNFDCIQEMDVVSVGCNRELQLQEGTHPAGYKLLSDKNIINLNQYINPDSVGASRQLTLQPGGTFRSGTYTFYMEAKIGMDGAICDTAQITWTQP